MPITPQMFPAAPALRSAWAFLLHLRERIVEDDCLRSAAALTYLTLFALVPLMTVAYAALSAVPAFDTAGTQVQQFVFSHFVPSTGYEIQNYLQQFSTQARHLTGIGIIFLVLTAYGMLSNIESTLNAIWRAPNRRRGLRSFLLYWAILSLGPLCIGLAIGISTYLLSLRVLFDGVDVFGLKGVLLSAAPMLLTSAAVILIYIAVPNCRVRLRDAVIGGVCAALCFELAKLFFTFALASSYERVYGTFATLPLFLLWIYLSWIIVLAGAELVFALSGYADRHSRHLPDLLIALVLLERLWQCHRRGTSLDQRQLLRERWLLQRYPLPIDRWARLRERLAQAGLLKFGDDDDVLLGRDLQQFTLWQLVEILGVAPPAADRIETTVPWLLHFCKLIAHWRDTDAQLLDLPLATLFAVDTQPATTSTTTASA